MKRKILIVEDNVALSQLQRDWLERCGYAVTTAMDEPAAKRVLKAENIALILSDKVRFHANITDIGIS